MATRKLLPGQTPPDMADIAGLMGPIGMAGQVSKLARKATPQMVELLQELLGEPLVNPANPKQLLRLSSVDPAAGIARLHTNTGTRVLTTITDFIKALRDGVLEEAGYLSKRDLGTLEHAGEAGERITKVAPIGPRGGTTTKTTRRPIPPTATR